MATINGTVRCLHIMPPGPTSSMFAIFRGAGVALARGFSVTKFWKDIHDSEATSFTDVCETTRDLFDGPQIHTNGDTNSEAAMGMGYGVKYRRS